MIVAKTHIGTLQFAKALAAQENTHGLFSGLP